MILKNGQHEEDTKPWVPQVEDINTDLLSIYLTSTQTLPIDVASKKYDSYFSSPISTNKFDSEQVVINSGRILFNAKSDNILLSSFDTINLNFLCYLDRESCKDAECTLFYFGEVSVLKYNSQLPILIFHKP